MFLNYLLKTAANKPRYTDIWKGRKERVFSLEEARTIGGKLGIDWGKIPVEEFRKGLGVEMEHGKVNAATDITHNDPEETGRIAWVHLKEYSKYYTALEKMEEKAKRSAQGRKA